MVRTLLFILLLAPLLSFGQANKFTGFGQSVINQTTLNVNIAADDRDGSGVSSYEWFATPEIEVGNNETLELRGCAMFSLNIAQGKTIDSCFITTAMQENRGWVTATDTIVVEIFDVDNAAVLVDGHNHFVTGHHALVGSSIAWSGLVTTVGYGDNRSPNLASLLQSVINRVGWSANNYVGFTFRPKTPIANHIIDFADYGSDGATYAPRIKVVYH